MKHITLVALLGWSTSLFAQGPYIPQDPFGEVYGKQWTYLYNDGQCFDLGGTFRTDILAQSVGTAPTLSVMKDLRTSLCFPLFIDGAHHLDRTIRLDWSFVGENVNLTEPEMVDPVDGRWNFYEEFTPQGVLGVKGAKRVVHQNIYDSIDYHILSNAHGPKFLFVIRPGGDPDDIRIAFEGHDSLEVDVEGMLKLYSGQTFVKLQQCFAYQQQGSNIVDIPWSGTYGNVPGSTLIKLDLGSYDPTIPLILVTAPWQPNAMGGGGAGLETPEWGTYLNGSGSDGVIDLAHDDNGFVYLTGFTRSNSGFPIFPGDAQNIFGGESDAFYGRCNANYEFEGPNTWMTYLGGALADLGTSIAFDAPRGRVVLCGQMASQASSFPNYPLASNPDCYQRSEGHGFVLFANASTGYFDYFTHYQYGLEAYLTGIDVDAAGNVYVVGYGDHLGFELTDPAGSDDYFWTGGAAVVEEGFIAKFTPNADHVWGTVLGGDPGDEFVYGVHVDRANDQIYVFGATSSHNNPNIADGSPGSAEFEFPLVNAGGWYQYRSGGTFLSQDGFITRFNGGTLGLTWATYIGGNGDADCITDIVSDASGNIFATGYSNTTIYNDPGCVWSLGTFGFPRCHGGSAYFQSAYGGSSDNVMLKFDIGTGLLWSTFVGGLGVEKEYPTVRHFHPRLAIDDQESVVLFANTTTGVIGDQDPPIPMIADEDYYYEFLHRDLGSTIADPTDTYLAVFDNTGTHLNSTYFGGTGRDHTGGLVAFNGRVYIGGVTTSAVNFPLSCPSVQASAEPYCNQTPLCSAFSNDAFMAQVRSDLVNSVAEGAVRNGSVPTLTLVPNPTTGEVRLTALNGLLGKRVLVLNSLGQTVMTPTAPFGDSVTLDLSVLADGWYLIGVIGPESEYIRVLKE